MIVQTPPRPFPCLVPSDRPTDYLMGVSRSSIALSRGQGRRRKREPDFLAGLEGEGGSARARQLSPGWLPADLELDPHFEAEGRHTLHLGGDRICRSLAAHCDIVWPHPAPVDAR